MKLRQQAEQRAETTRREEGQTYADSQTRKILRRFGMVSARAGAPGMGNFNPFVLSGLSLGASGSIGGPSPAFGGGGGGGVFGTGGTPGAYNPYGTIIPSLVRPSPSGIPLGRSGQ